ncbi:hypothetical protein YC2023_098727 [Brassica napus]
MAKWLRSHKIPNEKRLTQAVQAFSRNAYQWWLKESSQQVANYGSHNRCLTTQLEILLLISYHSSIGKLHIMNQPWHRTLLARQKHRSRSSPFRRLLKPQA